MRHTPLISAAVVAASVLFSAAPAMALPGDRAIDDSSPFRLNDRTLEPGCFVPGRFSNADIDNHLVIDMGVLSEEAHVSVTNGAPFSVDQVLVPSTTDGYTVYDEFDTGSVNDDPDIDPNQTATGLVSSTRFVDENDIIVCVSSHPLGDDEYNRPYTQEAGGLVSVRNRPILTPKVTAFGVSAISNLNTYRIGFGYEATQWYSGPTGDPNKFGDAVSVFPRADGTYDARRVNDVDKAGESWANLFRPTDEEQAYHGQNFLFWKSGDLTAWADTRITLDNRRNLLTDLTQGDLPIKWTLRPSLAPPSSKRSATFSLADFFAWNKSWQAYLCDGAAMPTLALAPGTNSPKAECPNPVHVSVTLPAPTPANPTPTPIVVNPTPVTVNAPVGPGAGAIADALADASDSCTSKRVIKFTWRKGSTNTKLRYRGKTVKGKMSNGRYRATADFRGYQASRGDLLKVAVLSRRNGRNVHVQRIFKAC